MKIRVFSDSHNSSSQNTLRSKNAMLHMYDPTVSDILCVHLLPLYFMGWALWKFIYRKSPLDNVPGPSADSFLTGVLSRLYRPDAWGFHKEILGKYGGVVRIKSFLGENQLLVSDPKALHQIIVKDLHIFEEVPSFVLGNRMVFGPGLFSSLGEEHKKQRKLLNPAFSIAHMRGMLPTFYEVTYKLRDAIARRVQDGPKEIDILSWMTRTALELIGQSGLGYSFDSLTEDTVPHPFSLAVKRFSAAFLKVVIARNYLLPTIGKIGTPRFRRFMLTLVPWKALQEIREMSDTMHRTSLEIFESKKKALLEGDEAVAKQIAQGRDIMSILLRANMEVGDDDKLSDEELVAQMSTLTFAAMETTSSALTRCLECLAQHQEVQDRLRLEIREERKKLGNLSYDDLVGLPYLDAVCRETLRLYAPVAKLSRRAVQDVVLSLGTPIKGVNGQEMSEICIPKGTDIITDLLGCNVSPEIWGSDSYEWKPERWLDPLPTSVTSAHIPGIYSNLMTFLGGGRACIGFKFSQLEMKTVLSLLIDSFKFSLTDKKVYWAMTIIATPEVVGESGSQLPIVVELAE